MSRLASGLWVAAYLQRLRLADIPCYVVARGDETAGAVLVVCATLDGRAVAYQRITDLMTGARKWDLLTEGTEADVSDVIASARRSDPDLWVIEIEDRAGRTLLDEPGLDA